MRDAPDRATPRQARWRGSVIVLVVLALTTAGWGVRSLLWSSGDAAAEIPVGPPHPPALVGAWYQGESRSERDDSLGLTLRADSTVRAGDRRWTLERGGWRLTRTERHGRWEVRYDRLDRPSLCVRWETSPDFESCEDVTWSAGTTHPALLQYAGRYWRPVPPVPRRATAARPSLFARASLF